MHQMIYPFRFSIGSKHHLASQRFPSLSVVSFLTKQKDSGFSVFYCTVFEYCLHSKSDDITNTALWKMKTKVCCENCMTMNCYE